MSVFFILLRSETGQPDDKAGWVPDYSQKWDEGKDAAEASRAENARNQRYGWTTRTRVRRVVETDSDNYIVREASLNHTPLPDCIDLDSYYMRRCTWMLPHMHPTEKFTVRFFESLEDAIVGKYRTMGMSRFLDRYTNSDAEEVLTKIGYYDGDIEFGITQDPELVQKIYREGPDSCMCEDGDTSDIETDGMHPAIVYSEGDLAVAYIKRGDSFTARAVVRLDTESYYCTYGHSALLIQKLKEKGYTQNHRAFDGARVKLIPNGHGDYVMPYIDACGYGYVSDCGKFIILDESENKLYLQLTGGSTEDYNEPEYDDDYY